MSRHPYTHTPPPVSLPLRPALVNRAALRVIALRPVDAHRAALPRRPALPLALDTTYPWRRRFRQLRTGGTRTTSFHDTYTSYKIGPPSDLSDSTLSDPRPDLSRSSRAAQHTGVAAMQPAVKYSSTTSDRNFTVRGLAFRTRQSSSEPCSRPVAAPVS